MYLVGEKIGHCNIVLFLNNVADLALELGENATVHYRLINYATYMRI